MAIREEVMGGGVVTFIQVPDQVESPSVAVTPLCGTYRTNFEYPCQ
jgi:hypothetical protein